MRIESHLPPMMPRTRASLVYFGAALFALSLCALLGCRGKEEDAGKGAAGEVNEAAAATCTAVGETLVALTTARLDGLSERQTKLMLAQQHLIKEKTVATCDAEEWPNAVRVCMIGAADLDAFNQCTAPLRQAKGLPPPAPRLANPPAPGPSNPPAPGPSNPPAPGP
jgi:hypothetical protein